MKSRKRPDLAYCMAVGLFISGLLSGIACAEGYSLMGPSKRTATWEFNVTSQYLGSSLVNFNGGASAEIDSTIGWGLGLGYNFTEYLELNFDAYWSDAGYRANYIDENGAPQISGGTLSSNSANVALTYNILPRRFTPFITGAVGMQFFNTDIPVGPPIDGCWWYPWLGQVCSYQPTYREDNTAYAALAGVRFEFGRAMYLKSSLGKHYIGLNNGGTHSMTIFRLNFGWMFR